MAQPYSDQVKAAVLAAILSGQSLRSVEQQYGVSRRTISAWRDAAHITGGELVAPQKKGNRRSCLFADGRVNSNAAGSGAGNE